MKWFCAIHVWRGGWGHTVVLKENPKYSSPQYYGTTVDPDEIEEVIAWTDENAQARRISYDTWQFKSRRAAEEFIMLYNLRWT